MINELMARAGASDLDREAWLAERRTGVTATEVRDLIRKGAKHERDLLAEKLDSAIGKDLSNIPAIAWGKQREPVLAAVLVAAGMQAESRVFHAAENPRYLASPDGVGWNPISDEIIVGEIKTASKPIGTTSDAFREYGYYDQMQWQMFVCGAARCLYVWEQHDGNFPNPAVLPHVAEWVERDDERIEYLRSVADVFLARLDGEREFTQRQLASIRVQAEGMAWHKAKAAEHEANLRGLIAGRSLSETIAGKRYGHVSVSYSGDKPKREPVVDMDAAKAAVPELFAAVEAAQLALDEALEKYTTTRTVMKRGRLTVKGLDK